MTTGLKTLTFAAGLALAAAAQADTPENFVIHELDQTPQEAAALIRDYVEADDDWSLNAEFPMMGGAAVNMKICFGPMRGFVAQAGLHNLALMPCGNIALYEEDGQTFLSMVDLSYLTILSPHPALEEGVAMARPAYVALFLEALGVE